MGYPRIAFIQPKLQGFGGLEKYGVHFIEALAERGPVDVLSDHQVDRAAVERAFGVRLERPSFVCDPRCNPTAPATGGRIEIALARRKALADYEAATRPYDLVVGQCGTLPWKSGARRSLLLCHFPVVRNQKLDGTSRSIADFISSRGREQRDIRARLDSWDGIICNSEYTRGWIRRYWDRDAEVIHPPVDVPPPEPQEKERWILGAGFFNPPASGDRWGYKRHGLLIETFRELCDDGLSGWELHLAGHMLRQSEYEAYLERLITESTGYPIHFHVDCPHAELTDLYRRSAIFWHATGYGIDQDAFPEQMEHFGIVTVEAMGWGCVPIVVNRGGQPEIVENGVSGYCWESIDELKELTRRVIGDDVARQAMSTAAQRRAQQFGLPRFRQQIRELLDRELACTS